MVAGVAHVEHGGRDFAVLHVESLQVEELKDTAATALADAEASRDASCQVVARSKAACQQAERELKVSKA
uniref:Uncharacterized protein n=1 Tax=Oryza punctata TaxID=4537 RepID=A0A0E0LJ62_ORYPU